MPHQHLPLVANGAGAGRGEPGFPKASGPTPKLSFRQKQQVFRWINGKDPRQYGFDFGLWTRRIVQLLVRERFSVRVSVTAVGRMLAELGITPQKPLRRAYERDPIAIAKWMEQDYPRLRVRAHRREPRSSSWTRRAFARTASWVAPGRRKDNAPGPDEWPSSSRQRDLGRERAGGQLIAHYVQSLKGRLELHFLPGYAPDSTPTSSSGTI